MSGICQHDDPSWCDGNTCLVPMRQLWKRDEQIRERDAEIERLKLFNNKTVQEQKISNQAYVIQRLEAEIKKMNTAIGNQETEIFVMKASIAELVEALEMAGEYVAFKGGIFLANNIYTTLAKHRPEAKS